jgi:hypothetical protein
LTTVFTTELNAQNQYDQHTTFRMQESKSTKNLSNEKSAAIGNCGNDTVNYATNKAVFLQSGFNDPTTGGWSLNRQSSATNVVTTAFKVPVGGSVNVKGVDILGLMMLTNYVAITGSVISTHKVYLYNVDATNKPTGLPIDSATIDFTNSFAHKQTTFLHGPHTLTSDFAIGVRGGATSDATHFLYVAHNQMHVPLMLLILMERIYHLNIKLHQEGL